MSAPLPEALEPDAPGTPETPEPAQAGHDVVLLARQPILDTSGAVHGHELLFRREDGTGWPVGDEVKATAHVLVAAFADMSLGAVTGSSRAWVNMPREFLLNTDLSVLPADRVVLELIERDDVDSALFARVVELARAGYLIALDDFTWDDDAGPLADIATYVKLDLRELGLAGIAEHIKLLEPHDVVIVAEKVETAEERDACLQMGIGLYQGYFFERPRLVRGRPAPSASIARLRIATSLSASSSFEDVEAVVRLDPGLSVRVLRYINSAAVSLRHRIRSLRHALMLVGANTVRQWLLLVLMGDLGKVQPAVLNAGLVRARLCESLARETSPRLVDSAFIVGLLSVCDALMETPLEEIIPALPLTEDLCDAIVHQHGPLGFLLKDAIALERGQNPAPDAKQAYALYDAVQWADAQLANLSH